MMTKPAKQKPWWNSDPDSQVMSKEPVEDKPTTCDKCIDTSVDAAITVRLNGKERVAANVSVPAPDPERRKARAVDPDVAAPSSLSPT